MDQIKHEIYFRSGYNGKLIFAIMAFFKEAFYLNRNSVADSAMLFVSVSKYSTCPNKSGT